jgi:hypothetical protein
MAMSPEQTEHAISFVTGEVHALFMFSQAVAMSHPNPQALQLRLEEVAQHGLASIEMHPVGDAVIEGFQFAVGAMRKAVESAMANSR